MNSFVTSFGKHFVSLSPCGLKIEIERLPNNDVYGNCFWKILGTDLKEEFESSAFQTLPNSISLPRCLKDGFHRLRIYFLSPYGEKDSYGRDICYDLFGSIEGVPFRKTGERIDFIPSAVLESNKSFISTQKEKWMNGDLNHGLKPSHMIQSTDPEIVGLAKELTKDSADTVSKIRDIYYYVSRTLQYDKDALDKGSYFYTGQTAYEALKNNKCVCQGFANLAVAMCRAIGIPSFSIIAYIKPNDCQWEDLGEEYRQRCESHQIALAWVNSLDRWLIMDPTWNEDQDYKAGKYGTRHGNGLLYTYFDTTVEFISYTHRFEEILDF